MKTNTILKYGLGIAFTFTFSWSYADSFEKYAVPIYQKAPAKPNFHSLPGSIDYKTRIRDEIKSGANFAGHYTIITFGCGAGCTGYFMVDVKSGKILNFPLGGEGNMYLILDYRPNSKLIKALWTEDSKCVSQELVLKGDIFKLLHQTEKAKPDDAVECE